MVSVLIPSNSNPGKQKRKPMNKEHIRSLAAQISRLETPRFDKVAWYWIVAKTAWLWIRVVQLAYGLLWLFCLLTGIIIWLCFKKYRAMVDHPCKGNGVWTGRKKCDKIATLLYNWIFNYKKGNHSKKCKETVDAFQRYRWFLEDFQLKGDEVWSPDELEAWCGQVVISACVSARDYRSVKAMEEDHTAVARHLCNTLLSWALSPKDVEYIAWVAFREGKDRGDQRVTYLLKYFFGIVDGQNLPYPRPVAVNHEC